MTYIDNLDNYDKKVRKECRILSVHERIRTGFRNKNDIKKAVAIIKDPRNRTAFGRAPIVNVNMDLIEDNLIKLGSQKPSGIRAHRLDRGIDQVIRPAINQGNDSNDDSSSYSVAGSESYMAEYSGGRDPISGSYISDWFGGHLNPQLTSSGGTKEEFYEQFENIADLFVSGMITQQDFDQLTDELEKAKEQSLNTEIEESSSGIEESSSEFDEVYNKKLSRRPGAGRPTRAEQNITNLTGQTAGEQRREAGQVVDEMIDDIVDELEEEERQAEYVPPPRRRFTPAVEEEENRGSGSGQSNPNAPSYAPSQYDRGESRRPGRNDFDREFDAPP